MTRALPPSMIATHELVVPRSMPMIFAMGVPLCPVLGAAAPPMSAIWGWPGRLQAPPAAGSSALGDGHQGRPQQVFVHAVALLEELGHGARVHALGLHHAHGLVLVRVEGLAGGGGDLGKPVV